MPFCSNLSYIDNSDHEDCIKHCVRHPSGFESLAILTAPQRLAAYLSTLGEPGALGSYYSSKKIGFSKEILISNSDYANIFGHSLIIKLVRNPNLADNY